MPQAIPIIIGAAANVIYGTVVGAIVTVASSIAVGLYERDRAKAAQRRARQKALEQIQDRITTVRSAISERGYVLGTVRTGGTLLHLDTILPDESALDMVVAMAANQCQLEAYYIADEYVTLANFPGDKYGHVVVHTAYETFEVTGPTAVVALRHPPASQPAPFASFVDGNGVGRVATVTIDETGTTSSITLSDLTPETVRVTVTYQYTEGAFLRVQFKDGSPDQEVTDWTQVEYSGGIDPGVPDLVHIQSPLWDSTHRLRGVCHLRTLMLWDESIYEAGPPNMGAVLRGGWVDNHPFYDPRDGSNPIYTDNPAILAAWWMTLPRFRGGMGIPQDWIDWDTVATAANICDELITVPTLDGTGTEQIKRYQCHTKLSTADSPLDNLQAILSSMAGRHVFTAGRYRIYAGAFRAATLTITDKDIVGDKPLSVTSTAGKEAPPNVITARFADKTKNWVETTPNPVRNQTYIDLDGHEEPVDIVLPATTDPRQAHYLMGVLLESMRPALTVTMHVGGIGENIALLDTVQLNITNRSQYSGRTFEVTRIRDNWDGTFELTLREIRPQTWALNTNTWTPANPLPTPDLSYLWNVHPITGLQVDLGVPQTLPDGNTVTRVELRWDPHPQEYVRQNGRIEIRYREAQGEWIGVPSVPGDSTGTSISASLIDETNYLFQVRAVNTIGAASPSWTSQWVSVEGTELAVGVQGPGIFTWANPVGVSTTSNSITKTGPNSAWDAGAHSLQSYSGGCFVSARVGQLGAQRMIALNDDPAIDANYTGLDYALHTTAANVLQVYESGILISAHGAVTESTVLAIKYDNQSVVYEKDGVPIRTVAAGANRRFFLDTSLYTPGASWVDVAFGPMGGVGPQGLPGVSAQSIRLSATSYAFTFSGTGSASPANQSITFTATRQNIPSATVWSTTSSDGTAVTLTGAGDTRTLTVANFGSRQWVRVRAEAGGFADEITVVRLAQGANGVNAIQAFLTNQNHTLAANPDGVVGSYAGANGRLFVFEGITDRTNDATLSIVSQTDCTVELNTAANSPVSGQPKGYYRVTSVTADQASAVLRAVLGTVTRDLPLTLTRAREGQPGDGQNLLPIHDWAVGTTGSQGPGGRWAMNGTAAENAIVLAGAGTAPLGPFGTSEILWECRPEGGVGETADGGWNVDVEIDHRRSYRSTVWVRVNQISGSFYHGCRTSGSTLNLNGSVNNNPYFIGNSLAALGLQPNKWYLSVGVIHGSGYTGGYSGVAGIYDPDSGRRVVTGTEFKNAVGATMQRHRCYHYYDSNSSTRQWMPKPRFEEINGSEPTIDALLGFQRTTPWVESGNCYASTTSFYKIGGSAAWGSDAIRSALSYRTCHLQFKPGTLGTHVMVGINSDPASDDNYNSIDFCWYIAAGALQIYESGTSRGNFGSYTLDTELAITFDGASVRYYKDRQLVRTVAAPNVPYGLDSSFHTPNSQINNVRFGPGIAFENISTADLAPDAATELAFTSAQQIDGNSPDTTNYYGLNVIRGSGGDLVGSAGQTTIFTGTVPFNCIAIVTATFTASASLGSVTVYPYLRNLSNGAVNVGAQYGFRTLTSTLLPTTVQGQFVLAAGQSYEIGVKKRASAVNLETWREPITVSIEYIKR